MNKFIKWLVQKNNQRGDAGASIMIMVGAVLVAILMTLAAPIIMDTGSRMSLSEALSVLAENGYVAYGAPTGDWTTLGDLYTQDIYPQADSTYDIGASGNEYRVAYIDSILSGNYTPIDGTDLGDATHGFGKFYVAGGLLKAGLGGLYIRNIADDDWEDLWIGWLQVAEGVGFADETYFTTGPADNDYYFLRALDQDGGPGAYLEVLRVQAASEPYVAFGAGQENKIYHTGKVELKDIVGLGAEADLTISGGAVTITQSYHSIVVEGGIGAGADQLDSANGGVEGDILNLKANTTGANDTVTIADGVGAGAFILAGGANFVMDHIDDRILLVNNGTEWVEISRSDNS